MTLEQDLSAYAERFRTRPARKKPLPAHLQRLEAESIFIMREVAAGFENPVMLYSIGKDSSVMLHLAMKAFWPSRPPFPFMHVDTTWKFREMVAFRDLITQKLGLDLIVHINQDGLKRGINPYASGSNLHTQVMKTEGLRQAMDKYKFDAAFGGARRDGRKHPSLPDLQLDRTRYLGLHRGRRDPDRSALFRQETADRHSRRPDLHGR